MGKSKNTFLYTYGIPYKINSIKDKELGIAYYINLMLNRVQKMFKIGNLPSTIPQREFKLMMFINGRNIIAKDEKGDLYCFNGGFGGKPNAYYLPTEFIVANPYLCYNKTFKVDEDCVLIRNDTMMVGLIPLFSRYAQLLVENDLTMRKVDINTRIPYLASAKNDKTRQSAIDFFQKVENGDDAIIGEFDFLSDEGDLRTSQFTSTTSNSMKDLIEYQQYLKASMFNDIGLNANYNMKRESLNSSESALNDDILSPLVDDMFDNWKEGIDKVNKMFGTNITIELDGVWKDNQIQQKLELKQMESNSDGKDGGDNGGNQTENVDETNNGHE